MAAKNNRCKGLTKGGRPCGAAATAGGLCFFHANPNKTSELGRIGGRANGQSLSSAIDLPALDNAIAVRDTVERLIRDVFSGKIPPRTAASLSPLLNLQLRVIDSCDHERRLAQLEKLVNPEGNNLS